MKDQNKDQEAEIKAKKSKPKSSQAGSIFKVGKHWIAEISLQSEDGKRRRKREYFKTRGEAQTRLNKLLHNQNLGLPIATRKQPLDNFLNEWLIKASKSVRPSTMRGYKQIIEKVIIPRLGKIDIEKLGPQHVQKLFHILQEEGLSNRRIQYVRSVLRIALNQAMRWGLVVRNAAALAEPPRVKRTEIKPLTPEQAEQFLDAVKDHRFEAAFHLALHLGLRKGEILGLRWADVDLPKKTLKVTQSLQRVNGKLVFDDPKSEKSRRTLPLSSHLVTMLKAHRRRQLEDLMEYRKETGKEWDTNLVFTTKVGTPVEPRNLNRSFYAVLENINQQNTDQNKPKLPHFRFHDLRHSCATFLLTHGASPKTVQDILGHSQISITLDTYSHVLEDSKREAIEKIENLFQRKKK